MSGEAIPRAAFGTLVRSEVRLAWRQPVGLVFGLGLPLVLLVVFGSIPGFRHAQANLGGATYFGVYLPILVTLVLAALGLASLPTPVATYREQGILRRLSTTPVPPSYVLAAQLLINLCIAAGSMVVLLVLGTAVFGAGTPRSVIGLAVAVVLSAAAIFAIGLLVAAVARTGAAAGLIGAAGFFPLMFFAGLWVPRDLMPVVLRDISDWTPLGASVRALQAALQTGFPPLASLAVLAGYALVFGWLSVRFFVWQ
jgi:ABC-2 type transport system permease protein